MRVQSQGAHVSRYTIIVSGSDEGFTAEFSTKELDLQSEGSTLSEALLKLSEELSLHENESEPMSEDVESVRTRYKYMN